MPPVSLLICFACEPPLAADAPIQSLDYPSAGSERENLFIPLAVAKSPENFISFSTFAFLSLDMRMRGRQ